MITPSSTSTSPSTSFSVDERGPYSKAHPAPLLLVRPVRLLHCSRSPGGERLTPVSGRRAALGSALFLGGRAGHGRRPGAVAAAPGGSPAPGPGRSGPLERCVGRPCILLLERVRPLRPRRGSAPRRRSHPRSTWWSAASIATCAIRCTWRWWARWSADACAWPAGPARVRSGLWAVFAPRSCAVTRSLCSSTRTAEEDRRLGPRWPAWLPRLRPWRGGWSGARAMGSSRCGSSASPRERTILPSLGSRARRPRVRRPPRRFAFPRDAQRCPSDHAVLPDVTDLADGLQKSRLSWVVLGRTRRMPWCQLVGALHRGPSIGMGENSISGSVSPRAQHPHRRGSECVPLPPAEAGPRAPLPTPASMHCATWIKDT